MKILFRLLAIGAFLILSGCASIYGLTGSDDGQKIDSDWVKYTVVHPGLDIIILESFSEDLLPISTVGKKSPSPLTHVIKFGKKTNQHELKIIGKYKKDLYLDGKFYVSIWSGEIEIKNGVLSLNGKAIQPIKI